MAADEGGTGRACAQWGVPASRWDADLPAGTPASMIIATGCSASRRRGSRAADAPRGAPPCAHTGRHGGRAPGGPGGSPRRDHEATPMTDTDDTTRPVLSDEQVV